MFDGGDDVGFVADVDDQRQRLAAGLFDFLGGGVDRAGQFRIGIGGLGGNRDVGAVARGAQRDRQANAAARAGDEEGFSLRDMSWAPAAVLAQALS